MSVGSRLSTTDQVIAVATTKVEVGLVTCYFAMHLLPSHHWMDALWIIVSKLTKSANFGQVIHRLDCPIVSVIASIITCITLSRPLRLSFS